MPRVRLEEAKEWQLTDKSNDIRGRELRDSVGRTLGTIQTMIVDTDSRQVEAVVLEDDTEYPVGDLQILEQAVYYIPAVPAPVAPPAPAAYAPPIPEPPLEVPSPAVPPPASPAAADYVPPTPSAPPPMAPAPAGDAGGALDAQRDADLDRMTPTPEPEPEPPTPTYVPPSPYAPPSDYVPPAAAYVPPTSGDPAVPPPAAPAPPIVQSPEPAVPPPAPPAGETAYPAEPYVEPYAEPPTAAPFTGTAIPGNYAEPVHPGDYTGDYTDAVGYTEADPDTGTGSYADAGGYTGEGSLDTGEPTPEPLDPSTLYTGSESGDDGAFGAGAYADADADFGDAADATFRDVGGDRDAATPGHTVTFGEAATYSETGAYADAPPPGDAAEAVPPADTPDAGAWNDARPVEPSLGGGAPVVAPPEPGHASAPYAGLAPEPAYPTHAAPAEADAGFASGTGPTDPPGPPPYSAPPYTPPAPPYAPPAYEAPADTPPPPPAYPGAPLAADVPAADADYRAHFGRHYADSGASYDDLADAYRFGADAASDPEFADGDEDRLRERFNLRYGYPAADRWAWLGVRDAVRRGYEGS